MAKTPRPFTVHRPGPIKELEDNLWTVDDVVPGIPGGAFPRKMSIVKLGDGRLLLFNAIPLPDAGMKELAALGEPAFLFAPSPFHCIDAHAMRTRLGVKVLAPPRAVEKVREVVAVDGSYEMVPADAGVRFEKLDGTKFDETALVVKSGDRTSIVFCDAFFNILGSLPGFWGWLWGMMGFTGGPRCGPMWLRRAVVDRAALRASMEKLAALPGLVRLVPSHGEPCERDAAATLRAVAATIR